MQRDELETLVRELRTKRNWSKEDGTKAIAGLKASRLSTREFASRVGVTVSRLNYWRSVLNHVSSSASSLGPSPLPLAPLIPVSIREAHARPPIVIVIGDEFRTEIHELNAASASWVAALLRERGKAQ